MAIHALSDAEWTQLQRLTGFTNADQTTFPDFRTATAGHFATHTQRLDRHRGLIDDLTPRVARLEDWTTTNFDTLENRLRTVDDWKTETVPQLKNLKDWKAKVDPQLTTLEDWKTDANAKLQYLQEDKLSLDNYQTDRSRLLGTFRQELADVKGGLLSEVLSVNEHLGSLEGKTKSLEQKVSEHDQRFGTYDGEFDKVRKEIKNGNDKLGKRISKQGKDIGEQGERMQAGFDHIIELLSPNNSQVLLPNPLCPGMGGAGGMGTIGRYFGPSNPIPSLGNHQSPGGINVANNYGDLSFRAPKCAHRNDPNLYDNGGGQCFQPCGCQSYHSPHGVRKGPLLPLIPNYPPSFVKVRRSNSGSESGNSNYNFTPNITLELSREGGGGLFGKPKEENMLIGMGGGGGGGGGGKARHRSSSTRR